MRKQLDTLKSDFGLRKLIQVRNKTMNTEYGMANYYWHLNEIYRHCLAKYKISHSQS